MKNYLIATLLIICGLHFSGCSGVGKNGNAETKPASKNAVKLTKKPPVDEMFLMASVANKTQLYGDHQGGFSGYIDKTGKVVLDMRKGIEWGVDKYVPIGFGKEKYFLQLLPFSEGMAGVILMDELKTDDSEYGHKVYGFIDKSGNLAVQPKYDAVLGFSEGLAGVLYLKKWGFVDQSGTEVVPPKFYGVSSFRDGLAIVRDENENCGYIDKTGKQVIDIKYKAASDFSDGLAVVEKEDGFFLIDKTGKETLKLADAKGVGAKKSFDGIERPGDRYLSFTSVSTDYLFPFRDGLLSIYRAENNYAFVGSDGAVKFPVASPYLEWFGVSSEGIVPVVYSNAETERLKSNFGEDKVSGNLECNFIDSEGKSAFRVDGWIQPFSEGLAGVKRAIKDVPSEKWQWEFINTKFETAIPAKFENVSPFEGGVAWVKVAADTPGFESFKDTNWQGYIDTTGKPIAVQWP